MVLSALCLLILRAGAASSAHAPTSRTVFQIGSFRNLAQGKYDATTPMSTLLQHGDLGVGTFQSLNGEMVVIDGKIYQGDSFGDANSLPADTTTPFACVLPFKSDIDVPVSHPLNSIELKAFIDHLVGDTKSMLALRIDGKFTNLTYRAFRSQVKPYRPYAQLAGQEATFNYPSIDGSFVGFRLPASVGAMNVPGYHFHFINDKRTRAGHVLAFGIESGTIHIMRFNKIELAK